MRTIIHFFILFVSSCLFTMEIELPTIQHLVKAVYKNDPILTQQIISVNPDLVNQKFDTYQYEDEENFVTPLHVAKKECAKVLLKNNAQINEPTSIMKHTPLYLVFLRNRKFRAPLAYCLLKYGADINSVDWSGNNMLHALLVGFNIKLPPTAIQFLLEHGINTERRNRQGQTPLDIAIINYSEHLPAFEKRGIMFFYKDNNLLHDPYKLLKKNAHLFQQYAYDDFPEEANERTKMECDLARLFIFVQKWNNTLEDNNRYSFHFSELDSPSSYGITTNKYGYCFTKPTFEDLYQWVGKDGVVYVKKHLKNRSKKAYKILQKDSNLFLKILHMYPYIINYNSEEQRNIFSYIMRTMKEKEHISFIEDVIRHLDDIDCTVNSDESLLHFAVKFNNPLVVKVLIDYDVDYTRASYCTTTSGGFCRTALDYAWCMNKHKCVESFYNALAKRLYIIDKYGANYNKIKKFLSEKCCDLHRKNEGGDTLLSMLCEDFLCSPYWCKVLLQLGACVNVKNNAGESPLYRAVFQNGEKTVKLFLEHGAIVTQATLKKVKDPIIKNMLETAYTEQQCCICYEHPETLGEIPCDNKHKGSFLCQECYNALEKCPFRCGQLHEFNAM